VSNVFGDANYVTKVFFGVRRETRFNGFKVDLLPEMVTEENADVNVMPRRAVRGTLLMLSLQVYAS